MSTTQQTRGGRPLPLLFLSVLALVATGLCAKEAADGPDLGFLASFLAGDYRLIGQLPNSGATYAGRVTLQAEGTRLRFTRIVGDQRASGDARIETSLSDRAPLLRMRFVLEGREVEGTYLWRSDLDNYPRLSGYIYLPDGSTRSPGLEALFASPPTPER